MMIVTPTGEQLFAPYQYGHGYATAIHEAQRILEEEGISMPSDTYFIVDEVNVSRKADMHNGGRR